MLEKLDRYRSGQVIAPEPDLTDYTKVHVLVVSLIAFVLGALYRIDFRQSDNNVNKAINEL